MKIYSAKIQIDVIFNSKRYWVQNEMKLTQLGEVFGNLQLLFAGQGSTRGLFSITQGGVENANVVWVVNPIWDVLGPLALAFLGLSTHNGSAPPNLGDRWLSAQQLALLGAHKGRHSAKLLGSMAICKMDGLWRICNSGSAAHPREVMQLF